MFKTGDLIAFSGNGLVSNIIKLITKSDWTHVAIFVDNLNIIESDFFTGVVITKESDIFSKYDGKIYLYKLDDKYRSILENNKDIFNKEILVLVGRKYDIKLILKFLLSTILPIKWGENLRRFVCSELVGHLYNNVGITNIDNVSKLTPNDIVNLPIFKHVERIK